MNFLTNWVVPLASLVAIPLSGIIIWHNIINSKSNKIIAEKNRIEIYTRAFHILDYVFKNRNADLMEISKNQSTYDRQKTLGYIKNNTRTLVAIQTMIIQELGMSDILHDDSEIAKKIIADVWTMEKPYVKLNTKLKETIENEQRKK